jgi:hypothetical protein
MDADRQLTCSSTMADMGDSLTDAPGVVEAVRPRTPIEEATQDVHNDDLPLVVNGLEMPITRRTWQAIKEHRDTVEWFPRSPTFKRVFYSLLRLKGVTEKAVNADVNVLSRCRKDLGLTRNQVWSAYACEKKVMNVQGRFLKAPFNTPEFEVMLLTSNKALAGGDEEWTPPPPTFASTDWGTIEAAALAAAAKVEVAQADIADEFRWIRQSLYEIPKFEEAPSKGAIKDWLTVSRPGNDALLRDFVTTAWSKRLAPGERKPRPSAFEEDKTAAVDEAAETTAEQMRRLFGVEP